MGSPGDPYFGVEKQMWILWVRHGHVGGVRSQSQLHQLHESGGGQSASLLAVQFSVAFLGACFLDRFL